MTDSVGIRSIEEILSEAERMTKGWTKESCDVELSPKEFRFILSQKDSRLKRVNLFITSGQDYAIYSHYLAYRGFRFNTLTNGKFEDYEKWLK